MDKVIFELEREKLSQVVEIIHSEICNYIEKRKNIGQNILKFRKEVLEEYKDDDDKIIEYFDHERFTVEESFKTIDRRLKELNVLSVSPYFGKVNFKEDGYDEEESICIGRFGMTKEDEYEPIVVDWRAPIASLFYAGKVGDVAFKVPSGEVNAYIFNKRQYLIKKSALIGVFDSDVDIKDEVLQKILSDNTSEKLKDIIMTIQSEQDYLIRQPRTKTIVVNGVAGSGKTTIALHRVAYLLYNFRNILQDKVLILGPNKIFMEYISTVLPSLGEVGVSQTTFNNMALEVLNINNIMSFKEYMEKVLDEDSEFINEIKRKNSDIYISELDELINTLENRYTNIQNVYLRDKKLIGKNEIMELFNLDYKKMPLSKRTKKIKNIIFDRISTERNFLVREINKEYSLEANSLNQKDRDLSETNSKFQRRNKIREVIKDVFDLKKSIYWLNNVDVIEAYSQFNGEKQFTQDDLAALLYLKIKLEGYKLDYEVKHVVIDEAQDYSYLQFLVIRQLTNCKGYTVVGDTNQRVLPINGEISMLNIENYFSDLEVENFALNRSYRSTKEIIEFANKYIEKEETVPLVRSGEEVNEQEFKNDETLINEICIKLSNFKVKGYDSTAIICESLQQVKEIGMKIKEKRFIKIFDRDDIIYKGGDIIIPSYLAKGLEFDAVILIDKKVEKNKNRKLKYVMATRALHELHAIDLV